MTSNFSKDVTAKTVDLEFTIPESASTVKLVEEQNGKKKTKKNKGEALEYNQNERKVNWSLRRFFGNQTRSITAIITLREEVNSYQIRKEIGPIKTSFEVNNYTASSVFIKYLRGEAGFDQKKPPQRWIRYITRSQSYVNRV